MRVFVYARKGTITSTVYVDNALKIALMFRTGRTVCVDMVIHSSMASVRQFVLPDNTMIKIRMYV